MSTAPSRKPEPIEIDGISYIPSSALLTGIPKLSFKDDRAFAVVDPQGEAPRLYWPGSELGIYFNDTRYIGIWETTINGHSPVSLAKELRYGGNTVVVSMTNRDIPTLGSVGRIRRDTFLIRRIMTLYRDTLYETLEIKNFDNQPHDLQIEQWIGSHFDDVFEVRGYPRSRRGRVLAPEETSRGSMRLTTLQYEGLDNVVRRAHIHRFFELEKIRMAPSLVGHFTRISVPPKETVSLKTVVSFDQASDCSFHGHPFESISTPEMMELLSAGYRDSSLLSVRFESDSAILNRSVHNATRDIFTLLTLEGENLYYPYAGVPWFSAPFGRDGVITAYQMLPWQPALARGVLNYALQTLGTKEDDFTDEQPGKVFHELRRGEMSNTREVPFIPYYGSVDSTPLTLILLAEYVRWTHDLERLRDWWPDALRALSWIDKFGDRDGDGFVEYQKLSPTGLVNQGWKDSHDSVMHADGALAFPPIRLCEVQGYVFRAKLGMSTLARMLGDDVLATRLRREALLLRSRFIERYWDSAGEYLYLALDGENRPCAVKSSNMGQCLWSQIVSQDQARRLATHLMSDAMFSGYGIRTLADTETAYNPLSYHNGSIWPHDNSLIMEGFRLYGIQHELERLATGAFSVLETSEDFRLPELFCGFRRRGNAPPVPYEVACKPQAWAAGSIFLMLKAMIGISMETDQDYVVFNSPLLTDRMTQLKISGLRCRDWEADFTLHRSSKGTTVELLRKTGKVRFLTVR